MNEDEAEAVRSLLDPLLRALEMLLFISRNLHPPDFEELISRVIDFLGRRLGTQ